MGQTVRVPPSHSAGRQKMPEEVSTNASADPVHERIIRPLLSQGVAAPVSGLGDNEKIMRYCNLMWWVGAGGECENMSIEKAFDIAERQENGFSSRFLRCCLQRLSELEEDPWVNETRSLALSLLGSSDQENDSLPSNGDEKHARRSKLTSYLINSWQRDIFRKPS